MGHLNCVRWPFAFSRNPSENLTPPGFPISRYYSWFFSPLSTCVCRRPFFCRKSLQYKGCSFFRIFLGIFLCISLRSNLTVFSVGVFYNFLGVEESQSDVSQFVRDKILMKLSSYEFFERSYTLKITGHGFCSIMSK